MSESSEPPAVVKEPEQVHGLLAEYTTPQELLQAARRVRDAGFSRWDTFSPFPVHGIDPAMGIRRTRLPWIVFAAGLAGGSLALFFQWWTSSVDYKWIVSGKPFWSVPANIPITFELTVLFAALSCFTAMIVLNRLPMPSHPLDRYRRFARVTDDRFFVLVQASDPKFDERETAKLLESTSPRSIETIMEDTQTPAEIPRGVIYGLVILASASTVPFALAVLARVSTNDRPRVHIVPDMDWQEKYKAQSANPFFADNRAMRLDVPGTVAQGELRDDDHFYRGRVDGGGFAKTFPAQVDISMETMKRGQERFGVYCTPCHGVDGSGRGMVHERARALLQGTWVPPTDLHQPILAYKPVGELFDNISRGVRNMPPYARQIDTADRWAIVLYLRALQRSGAASLEDLPENERGALQ